MAVTRAGPVDAALTDLADLLARSSSESRASRFLTGTSRTPGPRFVRRLLDVPGGGALLARVGGEAVGHAMWAPVPGRETDEGPAVEVALLVRDDHHRRGVGARLLDELGAWLLEVGVLRVRVTTLASNAGVLALVRRDAPDASIVRDGPELTFTLDLHRVVARRSH
ncbi:GNAT family N-acetyltransferase [Nocardioides marinquilinus]|uniref:GNAT family N-acetyltransferase n=1 Tax=Nocardioides marinquilinus TaxID=1210400 RepID=UPI0031EBF868